MNFTEFIEASGIEVEVIECLPWHDAHKVLPIAFTIWLTRGDKRFGRPASAPYYLPNIFDALVVIRQRCLDATRTDEDLAANVWAGCMPEFAALQIADLRKDAQAVQRVLGDYWYYEFINSVQEARN